MFCPNHAVSGHMAHVWNDANIFWAIRFKPDIFAQTIRFWPYGSCMKCMASPYVSDVRLPYVFCHAFCQKPYLFLPYASRMK